MPTAKNRFWRRKKILRHIFRFRGFTESVRLALVGISYLFVYHRNMRMIFVSGVAALLLGIYLKLSGIELVALCITITLVLMAEIFNTAIELIIDMRLNKYHTLVKLVKDISAAVVLIASVNALAVGYVLFVRKIFFGG
jgi:diacylglycerol kinase (ATP)